MLYIPPYWYYSIIYLDDPSTFVCKMTYNTFMNQVSNIKDLSLYFLQQQNITSKVGKKRELVIDDISTPDEILDSDTIKNDEIQDSNNESVEMKEEEKIHPDISNNILPFKEPSDNKKEENITYSVSNI